MTSNSIKRVEKPITIFRETQQRRGAWKKGAWKKGENRSPHLPQMRKGEGRCHFQEPHDLRHHQEPHGPNPGPDHDHAHDHDHDHGHDPAFEPDPAALPSKPRDVQETRADEEEETRQRPHP